MKHNFATSSALAMLLATVTTGTLAAAESVRIMTTGGQVESQLDINKSGSTQSGKTTGLTAKAVSGRTIKKKATVPSTVQRQKIASQSVSGTARPSGSVSQAAKVSPLSIGTPSQVSKHEPVNTIGSALDRGRSIQFNDILFDFNKATLKSKDSTSLNALADALNAYPHLVVEVQGHTDNQGDAKYNLELSQRRAKTVVDTLVSKYGIASNRLRPRGYGESRPTESNATSYGRQLNRRVEVKKFGI